MELNPIMALELSFVLLAKSSKAEPQDVANQFVRRLVADLHFTERQAVALTRLLDVRIAKRVGIPVDVLHEAEVSAELWRAFSDPDE